MKVQNTFAAGTSVMIAEKYLCDYIAEARRYLKGRVGVVVEQHPANGNVLVRWLKKGNRGTERTEWQRAKELVEIKGPEQKSNETKLSTAQRRVMKWLGNGWTTEPGAGMAIHVNGKRICNVDTMVALKRMGLVEQRLINGREAVGEWQATEDGKALANGLG